MSAFGEIFFLLLRKNEGVWLHLALCLCVMLMI
jgi:hypothetical protein